MKRVSSHLYLILPLPVCHYVQCQQNMACAVATEERLGIEYDEGTVCEVCRDVSGHFLTHLFFQCTCHYTVGEVIYYDCIQWNL